MANYLLFAYFFKWDTNYKDTLLHYSYCTIIFACKKKTLFEFLQPLIDLRVFYKFTTTFSCN